MTEAAARGSDGSAQRIDLKARSEASRRAPASEVTVWPLDNAASCDSSAGPGLKSPCTQCSQIRCSWRAGVQPELNVPS